MSADGVAWDWVNNKLYWTDAGHNTIEVYDQATEQRMTLINVGRVSIPRGLVVDPTTRFDQCSTDCMQEYIEAYELPVIMIVHTWPTEKDKMYIIIPTHKVYGLTGIIIIY